MHINVILLKKTLARGGMLALASSLAVSAPLALGDWLWPQGLSGGAEFIFWLASGVNTAGLLLLGTRYWPFIFVGILPAWLIFGQSLKQCLLGASGNCIEAVLAVWILRKIGQWGVATYRFDRTRTILSLLLAAGLAPSIVSLTVPAYLVIEGRFSGEEFWKGVANWNLANGCAILVLTPFFVALKRGSWISSLYRWESLAWVLGGLFCGAIALDAVFLDRGLNFTFLIFPFVIFCAVRFGPEETAAALLLVMLSIYGALVQHSASLNPENAPATIWFVQAFFWVLAATGLLVAALVAERRKAEQETLEEKRLTLEASSREERARLTALRYQINPHFLFNSLNSLRATLPINAEAPRAMVTELAGYLRSTLDHSDEDFATLRHEIEAIRNYLAIEKVRFGKDLQVKIHITPDAEEVLVPVFLLQPLAENAIRHGLASTQGRFILQIEAQIAESSRLEIEVANTGEWRKKESEGAGLGLNNVRRRLELLYGNSGSLEQIVSGGWVRLRITLPASQ